MLGTAVVLVAAVVALAKLEREGGLICTILLCAVGLAGHLNAVKLFERGLKGEEQVVAMEGTLPIILIVGLEVLGDPDSCTLFLMAVGLDGGVPLGHLFMVIIAGQDIIWLFS